MRVLKFRAWDSGVREFIYFHLTDNMPVRPQMSDAINQYTGLKDKSGTDIYEGDIVRQYFELTRGSYDDVYIVSGDTVGAVKILASKGVVIAKGRITNFEEDSDEYIELGANFKPNSNLALAGSRCEVIGNIYENPKLLNK